MSAREESAEPGDRVKPVAGPEAARWTLLVLTVIAVALLALIIAPFATSFFLAAVMAGALAPWYERLVAIVRGRRQIAAGLSTLAILIVVVLPVASISVTLAKEVGDGATYVRDTLRSQGVQGIIDDLPRPLRALAERARDHLPRDALDLQALTQRESGRAAAAVGGVLSATWSIVVQLVMMLIALFFFLVDGPKLVEWLEDVLPLGHGQTRRLLADFRRVSVAMIVSSVATAGIQALVALVG